MRTRPRDGDDWAQSLFARAREGLSRHRDGGESDYEHRRTIVMQNSAAMISRCRAASTTPRCCARHPSSVEDDQKPRHDDEHAWRRDGMETLSHRTSSTCATASEPVLGRTLTEVKTLGYECAFASHGWDGIQEQLSAIEQRLDASTRDLHLMRQWMGSLEERIGGTVATIETAEGGIKDIKGSDLASMQSLEDGEDNLDFASAKSVEAQGADLDESKFEALRRKVEELFAEMHGDVNSRLAAIANCLKEEADRNVADMVLRIDQRLLAAASQIDAFLCKSDMELVGGAQRAAHLIGFPECSQVKTLSKEENSESLSVEDIRESPLDRFDSQIVKKRIMLPGMATVGSPARYSGPQDLRLCSGLPLTVDGVATGSASLSLAVAAAAEAAAAPVGDPLSSPSVLKARMAALLTHIAEVIE